MIIIFFFIEFKISIYAFKITFKICPLYRACTRTECEVMKVVILDHLTIWYTFHRGYRWNVWITRDPYGGYAIKQSSKYHFSIPMW